jgi:hypothetical protein
MILTKKMMAASLLCGSLLCVPPAFAQTSGTDSGSAVAGSSANGAPAATPATDPGKNVTSPSTMGGSIGTSANGRPAQPSIPGSTAGDSALNNGTSPSGGQPSDQNANSAIQQRKAKSLQNQ